MVKLYVREILFILSIAGTRLQSYGDVITNEKMDGVDQMDLMQAKLLDLEEEMAKVRAINSRTSALTGEDMTRIGGQFDCLEEEALCTVEKKLGCGTFGCVFKVKVEFKELSSSIGVNDYYERLMLRREELFRRALSKKEDLHVAVKMLKDGTSSNLADIIVEATSWAAVPPHPSVVDLLHVEMLGGTLLFYSELVDGDDLDNVNENYGLGSDKSKAKASYNPTPLIDAKFLLKLSLQATLGVSHLHTFQLHHFDIKPANLMLAHPFQPQAQIKVCDFGLAQADTERDVRKKKSSGSPSVKAINGGSPVYMSPEIWDILTSSRKSRYCGQSSENVDSSTEKLPCCAAHDNWALALSLLDMWTSFSSNSTLKALEDYMGGKDISSEALQAGGWSPDSGGKKIPSNMMGFGIYYLSHQHDFRQEGFPAMPSELSNELRKLLNPKFASRPCHLNDLNKSLLSLCKSYGVDIHSLQNSINVKKQQIVDHLVLEGSAMMHMSVGLHDTIAKSDALWSAILAFQEARKNLLASLPGDRVVNASGQKYLNSLSVYCLERMAMAHYLLAREALLRGGGGVATGGGAFNITSRDTFDLISKSVSQFQQALVEQTEKRATELFLEHDNMAEVFADAMDLLTRSPLLDAELARKTALKFMQFHPGGELHDHHECFTVSPGDSLAACKEFLKSVPPANAVDRLATGVLQIGSYVRLKPGDTEVAARYDPCVLPDDVGTITQAAKPPRNMYKIATRKMRACLVHANDIIETHPNTSTEAQGMGGVLAIAVLGVVLVLMCMTGQKKNKIA